jgi:hypothetical protein
VGEIREKLTKFLSSLNFKMLYATLRAALNKYKMRDKINERTWFWN